MKTFNKVLVIDDDPVLRALAKDYFEARGTKQVLQAANGLEALDHLQQQNNGIDLILSDLNMPQLDGVEFLSRIKDLDYDGPIVIISGTYDVVIKMAQELGNKEQLNIAGALVKPFDPAKLDSLIAQM